MTEKVIQRTDTSEYWNEYRLESDTKWVKDISNATKYPSKYAAKQGAWAILSNHRELEDKLQIV